MTHTEMVNKWLRMGGDKTLRLNYDLNEDSIVIDGGGYLGEWANDIYNKYSCNVHIFEPVKKYYDLISEKFKDNNKVRVYHCGLSNSNRNLDITISNDASSIYTKGSEKDTTESIELVDIKEFLNKLDIKDVDLMKLNVEGEEYNILDRMIEVDMVNDFDNLQIQFHRFVDDYDNRKTKIETEILKSHAPTYEYNYVWVNYKKN